MRDHRRAARMQLQQHPCWRTWKNWNLLWATFVTVSKKLLRRCLILTPSDAFPTLRASLHLLTWSWRSKLCRAVSGPIEPCLSEGIFGNGPSNTRAAWDVEARIQRQMKVGRRPRVTETKLATYDELSVRNRVGKELLTDWDWILRPLSMMYIRCCSHMDEGLHLNLDLSRHPKCNWTKWRISTELRCDKKSFADHTQSSTSAVALKQFSGRIRFLRVYKCILDIKER